MAVPDVTSRPPDVAGPDRTRTLLPAMVGGAFLLALVMAFRNRPTVLYDDAAIILRYAQRIGDGQGWTYNPGDHTNGASAPLYTMVLALLGAVGIDLEQAARAVCSVSYALCVAGVTYLGSRTVGLLTGLGAGIVLLTWYDFQIQALAGMESAFAAALGVGVLIALSHRNETWAGILLGLALLNKLDAGMLALAVAAAWLLVERRPPWRIAAISAAMLTPWLLYSWVTFGSPLPNSFTQKLTNDANDAPGAGHDPMWIVDQLGAQHVLVFVVLALLAAIAVPRLVAVRPGAAIGLAVAILWPVLHAVVFSVLDLGAAFPWYLTVLYPPLAYAAAAGVGVAAQEASTRRGTPAAVGVVAAVVVAVGATTSAFGGARETAKAVIDGHTQTEFEAFEWARRDAAVHLASLAEPGEVIRTCFGWVAYEAADNTILETCPLNTRDPVGPPVWDTPAVYPGYAEPPLEAGAEIVRTFTSPIGRGGRIDLVRLPPPPEGG